MSATPPSEEIKELRQRRSLIGVLVLLVAVFLTLQVLIQRSPATLLPVSSTLLGSIIVLDILLLLVLLFVLGRNVIKLYVERRQRKLGSRFSTKVVVTYVGMALVPSVLLFLSASNLIQRSVAALFSTTTMEIVERSREVARQSALDQEEQLLVAAQDLAEMISEGRLLSRDSWQLLHRDLERRRALLRLDAISVYSGDELLIEPVVDPVGPFSSEVAAEGDPQAERLPSPSPPIADILAVPEAQIALALNGQPFRLQGPLPGGNILVRAGVPIYSPGGEEVEGLVVTVRRLPLAIASEASDIEALYRSYAQDMDQQQQISTAYQLTFLLMTLLIVFSALWAGLYLARGVALPIQELAEGTREVASGNLDYQVRVKARDELGVLVDSFNQMTLDLRAGQESLQHSRDSLQSTNLELDERRRYMEAVLANITTGVMSMNAEGHITTCNRAAERMLLIDADSCIGTPYRNVLSDTHFAGLRELMDRAKARRVPLEEELLVDANGNRLTIATHCSSLRDSAGAYMGTVVVLDDLTELIKAQKASAWREVARRIAHEIRNPLTPIQLSAQRIARRYRRAVGAEGQYDVIEEGTRTILQEVDTLKSLVSEFSRYARMPTAQPVPAELREILEASLLSCASMHDGIEVEREFDVGLPSIKADPEQLKRAFTNLFDNAIEAMEGHGTLKVASSFDSEVEMVRIEVSDTGPGIHPDDKSRLFLPYFSRKRDGTGLGLAIVHQIVADHRGYVRVSDNQPQGTVFIVELPRE